MRVELYVKTMILIDFPDEYKDKLMAFIDENDDLTWSDIVDITDENTEYEFDSGPYELIRSNDHGGNCFTVLDDEGNAIYSQ